MTTIYIAKFEYDTPRLSSAEVEKETEKRYYFKKGSKKDIINWGVYGNYADKDSPIFFSTSDAIAYLIFRCDNNIEAIKKRYAARIKTTEEWRVKLREL